MSASYAGIGRQQTPPEVCRVLTAIAWELAGKYTLRSGHAIGADQAFEKGADQAAEFDGAHGRREVYLPWRGFNGATTGSLPTPAAIVMASKHHANWPACSLGARQLLARNAQIILGPTLDDPVDFVLCWTKGGTGIGGGTGHALTIAKAHRIPIFDFGAWDNAMRVSWRAPYRTFMAALTP